MISFMFFLVLMQNELENVSVSTQKDGVDVVQSKLDGILSEAAASKENSVVPDSYERKGILEPDGRKFTYAVEGTARSLWFEYNNRGEIVPCNRLDDGAFLIKMDGPAVTVDSRGDGEKWLNICQPVMRFVAPLYFDKRMNFEDRLNWIRNEFLSPKGEYYEMIRKGNAWITLRQEGDKYVLKLFEKNWKHNPRLSVTFDTEAGLHLIKWVEKDGAENAEQWSYVSEINNEYAEVIPGVRMLVSGTYEIQDTGTAAKERPPHVTGSIKYTATTIGQKKTVPMDIDSLSIKPGSVVEDHRVDPHVVRKFGDTPIDPAILKNVLERDYGKKKRVTQSPSIGSYRLAILLFFNVCFLAIFVFLFLRRRRKTQ
ncbi:hypothetical protein Pan241w_08130 [Gimesia alba]|uniref:Uncharacterized protein n=1 Tax=Gimesia alba TaxID=2527973 RepID=A0A517RA31_9PLAN|nr:hypothetical protein [Gimesia alba]QDT40754.1 hypothetical protein Pan241w_08130 [Gimesia alba]